MQPALPKGFISIEEAVELINSDSREEAKVDIKWLVGHVDWIEEAHNFRIPLARQATKEEYTKFISNHPAAKFDGLIHLGSKFVQIMNSYDKEVMKKAIRDHYRDLVGHEYQAQNVRAVSSVADDTVAGGVRPRKSKPIAKEGAVIGTGETITTNGANL